MRIELNARVSDITRRDRRALRRVKRAAKCAKKVAAFALAYYAFGKGMKGFAMAD